MLVSDLAVSARARLRHRRAGWWHLRRGRVELPIRVLADELIADLAGPGRGRRGIRLAEQRLLLLCADLHGFPHPLRFTDGQSRCHTVTLCSVACTLRHDVSHDHVVAPPRCSASLGPLLSRARLARGSGPQTPTGVNDSPAKR